MSQPQSKMTLNIVMILAILFCFVGVITECHSYIYYGKGSTLLYKIDKEKGPEVGSLTKMPVTAVSDHPSVKNFGQSGNKDEHSTSTVSASSMDETRIPAKTGAALWNNYGDHDEVQQGLDKKEEEEPLWKGDQWFTLMAVMPQPEEQRQSLETYPEESGFSITLCLAPFNLSFCIMLLIILIVFVGFMCCCCWA